MLSTSLLLNREGKCQYSASSAFKNGRKSLELKLIAVGFISRYHSQKICKAIRLIFTQYLPLGRVIRMIALRTIPFILAGKFTARVLDFSIPSQARYNEPTVSGHRFKTLP